MKPILQNESENLDQILAAHGYRPDDFDASTEEDPPPPTVRSSCTQSGARSLCVARTQIRCAGTVTFHFRRGSSMGSTVNWRLVCSVSPNRPGLGGSREK